MPYTPEPRPAQSLYRLELLKTVLPFHIRARAHELALGQLVYYGPMPAWYGIGEVVKYEDKYVVVDFRGTGHYAVHQEVLEPQYLIPIPKELLALL